MAPAPTRVLKRPGPAESGPQAVPRHVLVVPGLPSAEGVRLSDGRAVDAGPHGLVGGPARRGAGRAEQALELDQSEDRRADEHGASQHEGSERSGGQRVTGCGSLRHAHREGGNLCYGNCASAGIDLSRPTSSKSCMSCRGEDERLSTVRASDTGVTDIVFNEALEHRNQMLLGATL